MDCNHWFNPTKELSKAFIKKVADKGWDLTYEVMLNYTCMRVLADALERASAPTRAARHRGARVFDLQRSHHALRPDQVRQWTELRVRSRPIRRS